jgi:non-specific protein-tyrosine kinase
MELIAYIQLFRRWAWLIFLAAFVGGSAAYLSRSSAVPVYEADTMLSIGSYISSPNPETGEIRLGQDLARTYAELTTTRDVLEGTIESLNLGLTPQDVRDMLSTRIVPDTSLLIVTVRFTDPILTAEIANEMATQLILLSPTNLTPEQQAQIDIAQAEIEFLRSEVNILRDQLQSINAQIDDADTDAERSGLIAQRNVLFEQINQSTANIATFTNTIASYSQRTNSVEIVEAARIPQRPIENSPVQGAVLGALVAATLAFGGVLTIEYLNDTFRSPEEISQALSLPVLGVISRFGSKKDAYPKRLITNDLFSQTHEQYRTFRTNLLFKTPEDRPSYYIVTSANPMEGKSVTAANLAVSLALADKRVLLVDADLRKPRIHEIFGLKNNVGLSTLLSDMLTISKNGTHVTGQETRSYAWNQCIQQTNIPNLRVITTGYVPSNPTEMLGAASMEWWTQHFKRLTKADIVIFDTPPVLAVSDALLLASASKGNVVLVVEANRTRRGASARAMERFINVGYDVMGVVLNNANPKENDYYGYYYSYYGSNAAGHAQRSAEPVNH